MNYRALRIKFPRICIFTAMTILLIYTYSFNMVKQAFGADNLPFDYLKVEKLNSENSAFNNCEGRWKAYYEYIKRKDGSAMLATFSIAKYPRIFMPPIKAKENRTNEEMYLHHYINILFHGIYLSRNNKNDIFRNGIVNNIESIIYDLQIIKGDDFYKKYINYANEFNNCIDNEKTTENHCINNLIKIGVIQSLDEYLSYLEDAIENGGSRAVCLGSISQLSE